MLCILKFTIVYNGVFKINTKLCIRIERVDINQRVSNAYSYFGTTLHRPMFVYIGNIKFYFQQMSTQSIQQYYTYFLWLNFSQSFFKSVVLLTYFLVYLHIKCKICPFIQQVYTCIFTTYYFNLILYSRLEVMNEYRKQGDVCRAPELRCAAPLNRICMRSALPTKTNALTYTRRYSAAVYNYNHQSYTTNPSNKCIILSMQLCTQ